MVKPRNLNLAVLRNDPNEIYEGTCLSTDTKPTNWPDNSILFELDTGTRYYSNSGTWYPVGGGADSGSGGGGGVTAFNLSELPRYNVTVDNIPYNNFDNSLIVVLYSDTYTAYGNQWFVNDAPNAPCILYRLDSDGATQYVPNMIGTFEDFQAEFTGSEEDGFYLESADKLTLYQAGESLIVFLTNPAFRVIGGLS